LIALTQIIHANSNKDASNLELQVFALSFDVPGGYVND